MTIVFCFQFGFSFFCYNVFEIRQTDGQSADNSVFFKNLKYAKIRKFTGHIVRNQEISTRKISTVKCKHQQKYK